MIVVYEKCYSIQLQTTAMPPAFLGSLDGEHCLKHRQDMHEQSKILRLTASITESSSVTYG